MKTKAKAKTTVRATPGISIPADVHAQAKARCAELDWTFSKYVQRLVMLEIDRKFFGAARVEV